MTTAIFADFYGTPIVERDSSIFALKKIINAHVPKPKPKQIKLTHYFQHKKIKTKNINISEPQESGNMDAPVHIQSNMDIDGKDISMTLDLVQSQNSFEHQSLSLSPDPNVQHFASDIIMTDS